MGFNADFLDLKRSSLFSFFPVLFMFSFCQHVFIDCFVRLCYCLFSFQFLLTFNGLNCCISFIFICYFRVLFFFFLSSLFIECFYSFFLFLIVFFKSVFNFV